MKPSKMLAPAALVALLLAAAPAQATTVADCQLQIATLAEQTSTATFLRGDKGVKTELQLLHQLTQTSKEMDQLDFRSAVKQMGDYSTDLARAVGSSTITVLDAAALQTGADSVVACIQQIQ